jgi:hypothetical protein
MGHIQQRDGRWCIVDLCGKHGRVRTVPMPVWVKVAIDAWTVRAGVTDGYVFRPVNRADQVQGEVLSEKVVWQVLGPYAEAAGVPDGRITSFDVKGAGTGAGQGTEIDTNNAAGDFVGNYIDGSGVWHGFVGTP